MRHIHDSATGHMCATVIPSRPSMSGASGWFQLSLFAGALLTCFDAFLLQQRKAFFTGGFLAIDHARSVGEILLFLALSVLTDAAVAGVLIAAALWVLGRLRLAASARAAAALLFGLGPLLVLDFVEYRLAAYLGDAFDLALLFDLTGRQPDEMLAIAAPHSVTPGLAVVAVGMAAGALVWALQRVRLSGAQTARLSGRVLLQAIALLVVALAATAVARDRSDVLDNGLRRKPSGKALGAILHAATDVDRDGFGFAGLLPDVAPFDSARFPYALDVPGNGIDDNGVGGDLPASLPAYVETPPASVTWASRPNVVLIVLESFRADLVGARVNGAPVTPVLDELAAGGLAVPRAFSHNGYTSQSRFHLMSGSLANLRDGRTLVDDFKAQGYEVAFFSGQDESFGGLPVGFDRADVAYDARQDRHRRYTTFTTPGSLAVPHQIVRERLEAFLARRHPDRPLFLYVNFHDTHYPYQHEGLEPLVSGARLRESQIGPGRSADLREMYANAAANVDRAIGQTLALARRHLATPPAVIVTSDHGESLFDEGFLGHGYALNDAQTGIPLIANGLPLTLAEPFGQIDLRDALCRALASGTHGARPRVQSEPGGRVFQYLGNIDRPRQIAFADSSARLIYDFRTRLVQLGGGWRSPDALDPEASRRFHELVHFWERLALARSRPLRGAHE